MQKNRLELAAILLTVAMVFGCGGYYFGTQNHTAVYEISAGETLALTQGTEEAAEEAAPSEEAATEVVTETTADTTTEAATETTATSSSTGDKVTINTATSQELQTLSGIGEVKAQAIIDYREAHGDFTVAEDLLKVSGIGEATLEKILDYITVD